MVEPLTRHTGRAAVLRRDNVDTDQIIPSREMRSVSRTGLADGLFAGWRYTKPGGRLPNSDFVLNKPPQKSATILVSGSNFGCGSSREHAVWALAEYGFRAILAENFGEIFYGNCIINGIVPIVMEREKLHTLSADAEIDLTIDLIAQTVSWPDDPDWTTEFSIDSYAKRLLTSGLDPIGLTQEKTEPIDAFLKQDAVARPWIYQTY